jgi:hypothetical protein
MMSATHVPLRQTRGAQHCVLSAQPPVHVPLLHACPLQSLHVRQLVGAAHVGVNDGVRIVLS